VSAKSGELHKAKWQEAFTQFEQDSRKAATQFEQDQKRIQEEAKRTADFMAGEATTFVNAWISGSGNMRQVFVREVEKMADMLIKKVFEMIAAQIAQTAVTKAANKELALSNARSAAAAAFNSAAQIPYIGWIIAPIAGATVYAGVIAFAQKGYDVPPGVAPITQLHPNEMVLPAEHADAVRSLRGLAVGAGGGGHQTNNLS
jgi:hypothetical protein